ncbi:MAG: PAS domain-containing protein, partial [Candidatus Omnitrophica bacterium]|nr:PAS domain-containing protein [Candidatus Omnitrophota bacterium]
IIVTDEKFKIIFVNKAAEQLYGYSKKKMLGRSPDFLNAEPASKDIQRKIYRTVRSGKTWVGRHLNRKKDKSTFVCEFKITPVKNESGEIYCYCALQRDVTDKEEMQKIIL